jgi:hypothetical protein
MKTIVILTAAILLTGIQPVPAQDTVSITDSWNRTAQTDPWQRFEREAPGANAIEDRRYFWNGYWGDRTKGEDAFTDGEVHGWVHPLVTNPNPRSLDVDPYPPGFDEQPPPRQWYDSKNGLRR